MNSRSDTLVIGIAFASFIAVGFNAGLMGVSWPSIRDGFDLSQDAVGVLLLVSTVGALAVSINSGALISHVGLGRLLAGASAVAGMGFLGFALAPTWAAAIALSFGAAAGTAALIAAMNTFFAVSQSARLMNWLQACFGLGAALSPIALSRLIESGYSWRVGYLAVVILYLGLAVAFGLTLVRWRIFQRESDSPPQERDTEVRVIARSSATLRLLVVWLSLLLFFSFTGMEGSAAQWPYTLFTEARSVDPRVAGLWISIFWATITVGRVFFGIVIDHVGAIPLVRTSMAGVTVGSALIWWNPSHLVSFLGLALVGFASSPQFPVLTSDTPRRVGREHAANAVGFQMASGRLGLAVVPALGGVLAVAYGLEIIGPFLFSVAAATFCLHEVTVRFGRGSVRTS
jgi:fucose permease